MGIKVTHGLFQPDVQAPKLVRRIVIQGEHVLEEVEARRGLAKRVVTREAGVPRERPDVDRRRDDEGHFKNRRAGRSHWVRDGYRV